MADEPKPARKITCDEAEAAPDPEDVRAWLDHVTGADAEAGPEVVALPPRMH